MYKKIFLFGIFIIICFLISNIDFNNRSAINTIEEKKNNNEIETKSIKKLYSYQVPKISEEKFNSYYEIINEVKTDDVSYNNNIKEEMNNEEIVTNFVKEDIKLDSDIKLEENITIDDNNESKDDTKTEENEKEDIINESIVSKTNEDIKEEIIEKVKEVTNETVNEKKVNKNGFAIENNNTYYYEDGKLITGIKNIDGKNHYFTSNGVYLGTNNIKVIDVSYHQGSINWQQVSNSNMIYGVILRIGYYNTLDKSFLYNLSEVKRLNIPYGIYLYSYATTTSGAIKEADFVSDMIIKYDLNPSIGIFYDLESWKSKNASSDVISKNMYDEFTKIFVNKINNVTNNNYNVGVYSGRWYAMNRLGSISKSYVKWVAEYNKTCKYDGSYLMWQYTSKGSISGIKGNVDISYIL